MGGFIVDEKSFCKIVSSSVLLLLVLTFCLTLPKKSEARGYEFTMLLKSNVVRIKSTILSENEKTEENGFGFIVGIRNKYAYIVTANHIVSLKDPLPGDKVNVEVTYFMHQDKTFKADSMIMSNKALDLALIKVEYPKDLEWTQDCLGPEEGIERGTNVWFLGRDEEWKVPTTNGTINDEPKPQGYFIIDTLPVRPGSSGAPIISEYGILGMLIKDDGAETQAIPIAKIKQIVDKEWNLPWNLKTVRTSIGMYIGYRPLFGDEGAYFDDLASTIGSSDSSDHILTLGMSFSKNHRELRIYYDSGDFGDIKYDAIGIDGLYFPRLKQLEKINYYLGAGIYLPSVKISGNYSASADGFGGKIIGGAQYYLSDRFIFELQADYRMTEIDKLDIAGLGTVGESTRSGVNINALINIQF
jgi:hypothetical protein